MAIVSGDQTVSGYDFCGVTSRDYKHISWTKCDIRILEDAGSPNILNRSGKIA